MNSEKRKIGLQIKRLDKGCQKCYTLDRKRKGEKMDKIKVGYRLTEENYKQAKELAIKERWSLAKLSVVAMEYYLKLRGYKIEEA